MTTLELQKEKNLLVDEILNLSNEDFISVRNYLRRIVKKKKVDWSTMPGQYTHEEKMQRIAEAEAEFERGEGYTLEEVFDFIKSL